MFGSTWEKKKEKKDEKETQEKSLRNSTTTENHPFIQLQGSQGALSPTSGSKPALKVDSALKLSSAITATTPTADKHKSRSPSLRLKTLAQRITVTDRPPPPMGITGCEKDNVASALGIPPESTDDVVQI